MIESPSLFDDFEKLAAVRRDDPSTAKTAAASNRVEKARQWKLLLRRLHEGPISADTGGRIIGKHRSIASSRFGVMKDRGLVENAGRHMEPDAYGVDRLVLRYRITAAGEREFALMFGGQA